MRLMPLAALPLLLAVVPAGAQTPRAKAPGSPKAKVTPEQQQATAAIHQYFRRTTRRLADACLADVRTLDYWQRLRPRLRRELAYLRNTLFLVDDQVIDHVEVFGLRLRRQTPKALSIDTAIVHVHVQICAHELTELVAELNRAAPGAAPESRPRALVEREGTT